MNAGVFVSLGPIVVIAVTVVVLIIVIAIHRSPRLTATLTLAGLMVAILLLRTATPHGGTALLTLDSYARFYTGLILAATAAVTLLSVGYLEQIADQRDDITCCSCWRRWDRSSWWRPRISCRSFLGSSC